ncbi:hypothetical protein ACFV0C_26015 [Streptomyces sp. NPDC059568]|uniref:hypothetical protein n=1 Tax=Streptomyces sp. NPDC059568 TaxID=3346868 RepID=UPI0036CA032C
MPFTARRTMMIGPYGYAWAAPGTVGEAAPAEREVSVRCLVTEGGSEGGAVPEADGTPGTVAVVARAS